MKGLNGIFSGKKHGLVKNHSKDVEVWERFADYYDPTCDCSRCDARATGPKIAAPKIFQYIKWEPYEPDARDLRLAAKARRIRRALDVLIEKTRRGRQTPVRKISNRA